MWFGLAGPQMEWVNKVDDKFTAENPGIKVELVVVPEADVTTKLAAAIAGGAPPDLSTFGGPTRIAELIENKQVESLTKYRKDIAKLDWYDAIKSVVVRGDDMYALPVQSGALAFFYNVDLYTKAGLDPNKPPQTWDDVLKNAKAIAKPDQQIWGHYVGTKPITWTADQIWIAYLWQAGGEWMAKDGKTVAFNSDAGVEALQFWTDLVQTHKVAPQKSVDNVVMGGDFESGTVGQMTLYSVWAIRSEAMKFPVKTAPMPRHKQFGSVAGIGTVPIFRDSKKKDAAWKYLNWLSQPDNAVYYLQGFGSPPARQSIADSLAWKAFAAQHPLMQAFLDSQKQARQVYYGKGAQEIAVQVAQAIEAAVFKQKTPRQALDDAAKASNAILARA